VAALDYQINVSEEWEHAVVVEADQIENLADAATVDGLTGLYMREIFDSWLEKMVAEKIRRAVEKHFAEHLVVTISIGVASWQSDMRSPTGLVEAADQALYEAKQAGKNRVSVYRHMQLPNDDYYLSSGMAAG